MHVRQNCLPTRNETGISFLYVHHDFELISWDFIGFFPYLKSSIFQEAEHRYKYIAEIKFEKGVTRCMRATRPRWDGAKDYSTSADLPWAHQVACLWNPTGFARDIWIFHSLQLEIVLMCKTIQQELLMILGSSIAFSWKMPWYPTGNNKHVSWDPTGIIHSSIIPSTGKHNYTMFFHRGGVEFKWNSPMYKTQTKAFEICNN